MKKFRVCLTGGIASGKTHVSDRLAKQNLLIIDTDLIARDVVKPGSEGLQQLVDAFGGEILNDKRGLNRSLLKQMVFSDAKQLETLNGLLHPMIWQAAKDMSSQSNHNLEVWVIPLFDGQQQNIIFDRVLVIDVDHETQLKRVLPRDGVAASIAETMINSQASRSARLQWATDVIVNNTDLTALNRHVDDIYHMYQSMVATRII